MVSYGMSENQPGEGTMSGLKIASRPGIHSELDRTAEMLDALKATIGQMEERLIPLMVAEQPEPGKAAEKDGGVPDNTDSWFVTEQQAHRRLLAGQIRRLNNIMERIQL